mmetsp:Transcript_25597/g.73663  ORF Transcript_25597/g.73663 Transcript_25597/m.73663 type:complete len:306 (-) Transcript_25597:15-932(-)
MRRSCSTLSDGSFPDKSTRVNISLASMAFTKYSPACAVMPFRDNMSTRKDRFSLSASANLIIPFWSLPFAVRLLLSRFKDCRCLFFRKASAMASADLTPKLLPSHSSFWRNWFFSKVSPKEMPSSSHKPFRLRSMDMQDSFCANARVRTRKRTEPNSSMPQIVMCGALMLRQSVSTIWSNPPSIFFRCSSSSRRFRSASRRFCSWICFCFFAACSSFRLSASSFSFFFLNASAASFFLFSSSILRFWRSSVRFVFGSTSFGGLKTRAPSSRTSFSSSSYGDASPTAAMARARSCRRKRCGAGGAA